MRQLRVANLTTARDCNQVVNCVNANRRPHFPALPGKYWPFPAFSDCAVHSARLAASNVFHHIIELFSISLFRVFGISCPDYRLARPSKFDRIGQIIRLLPPEKSRTFNAGKKNSLRNFYRKYTISTARSAGVMPLIRLACPRFAGRIFVSFSRASARSCGTAA